MNADYSGKGVDQLANVIDQIKNDPDSKKIFISFHNFLLLGRRIILCSWNAKGN
jgi:thymidylate synthase